MRRSRGALLLVALAAAPAAAQPPGHADHTVTGRVRDDRTDAPVAGVSVEVFADISAPGPPRWATRTTDAGEYRLAGVPAGRWWLRLRRTGYFPAWRPLQAGDCGVVGCDDRKHFYITSAARF
ncbi:carboxypeptidase-like regulatory domain-containing protein [Roseisolibacter sp. H3M3-2]|uniref:carboxypeptidase-like regulatory domain-containing protein n=1 Tax=Roseisolibacter sp. H3M3-2 TaxID=3031323 RepID=UPI0023DA06A3|nr:carboxypeptidase-like regulatory domain-containing protein [Roseisolibacter sp. H3M3-2]